MATSRAYDSFLDESLEDEERADSEMFVPGGIQEGGAASESTPLAARNSPITRTYTESTNRGSRPQSPAVRNNRSPGHAEGEGSSKSEALFHVLKGNIGTGLLGLPNAFAYAGLPLGIIGMSVICILAVHCMFLLVRCAKRLRETTEVSDLHYAKVAELSFRQLPEPYNRYGKVGKFVVNLFLILTQLGLCCVYVFFVARNAQQILAACDVHVAEDVLIALQLIILLPGSYIRKLKHLAPLSSVATIVQVVSVIIIFVYLATAINVHTVQIAPNKPSLFFGTAVFSLEGICLVLPLESDMRDRSQFKQPLLQGMVITSVLYLAMGTLGALAFSHPLGSITLNLPHEGIPKNIPYIYVRLFYAFSIVATYFIQFYVPMAIMQRKAVKFMGKPLEKFSPYIMRTFFVGVTIVIAVVVPRLDLAISLVGSFSSSTLALIFPPVLELIIFWNERTGFMVAKDIGIILFGLTGMVVGTFTALHEMIAT